MGAYLSITFCAIIPAVFNINAICIYDICKRFGSLVENSRLRKRFEPHKVMLINIVAMVAYVFNKLLPLLFNMNTLVSYYS